MEKVRQHCKLSYNYDDEYDVSTKAKFDIDYLFSEKVLVKLRAEVTNCGEDISYTATASFGAAPGTALFNFINDGDGYMPQLSCSAAACALLLESAGIEQFKMWGGPQKGTIYTWPPKNATDRNTVLRLALTEILDEFCDALSSVKRAVDSGITDPGWSTDDPLVAAAISKAEESEATAKPIRRGKRYYVVAASWC